MIHLATFTSEMEAQLLGSRLKEAGIDYKVEQEEGSDEHQVMVFEDDLDEATEVMEAAQFADDEGFEDDLGEHLGGDVRPGFGIGHLDVIALTDERADFLKCQMPAVGGVVVTAVRVFPDIEKLVGRGSAH